MVYNIILSARPNFHQLLCSGNILKYTQIYSNMLNSHQLLSTGNILKTFSLMMILTIINLEVEYHSRAILSL